MSNAADFLALVATRKESFKPKPKNFSDIELMNRSDSILGGSKNMVREADIKNPKTEYRETGYVFTGDWRERQYKIGIESFAFDDGFCDCCGCNYTPIPYKATGGLCDKCYSDLETKKVSISDKVITNEKLRKVWMFDQQEDNRNN